MKSLGSRRLEFTLAVPAGADNDCPQNANTHGQMAAFLTKTFGFQ